MWCSSERAHPSEDTDESPYQEIFQEIIMTSAAENRTLAAACLQMFQSDWDIAALEPLTTDIHSERSSRTLNWMESVGLKLEKVEKAVIAAVMMEAVTPDEGKKIVTDFYNSGKYKP